MEPKKIFIIRPVRTKIAAYVASLENRGYEVYDPERDNPFQKNDTVGIQILAHNCQKMIEADEIHIWFNKDSTGSIFDIGMFFMFVSISDFKKFTVINSEDVSPTSHKSFENVILTLAREFNSPVANGLKEKWRKMKNKF